MELDRIQRHGKEAQAKASLFTAESRVHSIASGTGAHSERRQLPAAC